MNSNATEKKMLYGGAFKNEKIEKSRCSSQKLKNILSGAYLGFSRGGGEILSTFFFRSTELIFGALPKLGLNLALAKFSAPQAKF